MTGTWITTLRQQLGLSQVELAALLNVSNVTVNRWENDKAEPQPAALERLTRLERDGLGALHDGHEGRSGNLPRALGPLIGRDDELEAVAALIARQPLVMVTGAAGTGKTRLAVEAARQASPAFTGGVQVVDLAAVSEAEDAAYAAARVLRLREFGRRFPRHRTR